MGRLDLPDPVRDEDLYPCTCAACNPKSLRGVCVPTGAMGTPRGNPEIGSDAWLRAEIAAGRSGDERDALRLAVTPFGGQVGARS